MGAGTRWLALAPGLLTLGLLTLGLVLLTLEACSTHRVVLAPETGPTPDGPALCRWALAGASARVSGDPATVGRAVLADAVTTGDAALVAWLKSDSSSPDLVWARQVPFDLSLEATAHVALRGLDAYGPLSRVILLRSPDRVAVAAWNEQACTLRPLTLDGASNGVQVTVDARPCLGGAASTTAGPGIGFDLLLSNELNGFDTLVQLPVDPSGTPQGPGTVLPGSVSAGRTAAARVVLADRSALMVTGELSAPRGRILAQHLRADAAPLGSARQVADGVEETTFSAAAVAEGAVIVWSILDAEHKPTQIQVGAVDGEGRLRRDPVTVTAEAPVTRLHLAADDAGGALVAWVSKGPDRGWIHALALTTNGVPRGPAIATDPPLVGAGYADTVRVVASKGRALVLLQAGSSKTPDAIYAAPLVCQP